MTLYLSFRSHDVGGSVSGPTLLEGEGAANPLALRLVGDAEMAPLVAGKNVLFVVHGFNVSGEGATRAFARFEPRLALYPTDLFIGVLWPGDFWLPVVNYPFEGAVSMDCGRRLAEFCRRSFRSAQSFSLVSHSLGARLVLEAVEHLDRRARLVCLMAAAVNCDCLATEYAGATANASAVELLASHADLVLRVAFRVGDPIADLLHDDHRFFEKALGFDGPPVPVSPPISQPWQIPDALAYGHGDYLPSGDVQASPDAKWQDAADFVARAFRGQKQIWP